MENQDADDRRFRRQCRIEAIAMLSPLWITAALFALAWAVQ